MPPPFLQNSEESKSDGFSVTISIYTLSPSYPPRRGVEEGAPAANPMGCGASEAAAVGSGLAEGPSGAEPLLSVLHSRSATCFTT